ncbi:hypothetical protein QR680_012027 [Steinernema hermaphroditum]|uniref:C2H2-type domain-containing protein n=1 Tax=Steinernema hermaphroditum TaxID=289476 RepID=A0AA39I3B7_9BILA|nr:hypothetical protein QR680_012027 [Steinernema hermaphroditum]
MNVYPSLDPNACEEIEIRHRIPTPSSREEEACHHSEEEDDRLCQPPLPDIPVDIREPETTVYKISPLRSPFTVTLVLFGAAGLSFFCMYFVPAQSCTRVEWINTSVFLPKDTLIQKYVSYYLALFAIFSIFPIVPYFYVLHLPAHSRDTHVLRHLLVTFFNCSMYLAEVFLLGMVAYKGYRLDILWGVKKVLSYFFTLDHRHVPVMSVVRGHVSLISRETWDCNVHANQWNNVIYLCLYFYLLATFAFELLSFVRLVFRLRYPNVSFSLRLKRRQERDNMEHERRNAMARAAALGITEMQKAAFTSEELELLTEVATHRTLFGHRVPTIIQIAATVYRNALVRHLQKQKEEAMQLNRGINDSLASLCCPSPIRSTVAEIDGRGKSPEIITIDDDDMEQETPQAGESEASEISQAVESSSAFSEVDSTQEIHQESITYQASESTLAEVAGRGKSPEISDGDDMDHDGVEQETLQEEKSEASEISQIMDHSSTYSEASKGQETLQEPAADQGSQISTSLSDTRAVGSNLSGTADPSQISHEAGGVGGNKICEKPNARVTAAVELRPAANDGEHQASQKLRPLPRRVFVKPSKPPSRAAMVQEPSEPRTSSRIQSGYWKCQKQGCGDNNIVKARGNDELIRHIGDHHKSGPCRCCMEDCDALLSKANKLREHLKEAHKLTISQLKPEQRRRLMNIKKAYYDAFTSELSTYFPPEAFFSN